MNTLAHAWVLPSLEPQLLLGAVLPDLLGAWDRRAPRLTASDLPALAEEDRRLALGLRVHQAVDACFHELPAFTAAQAALRPLARELQAAGARVRGFFLTHLLVELLIDAELTRQQPDLVGSVYQALAQADRAGAASLSSRVAGTPRDPGGFLAFTERWLAAGFLADYGDDERLCTRVEQVLGRARQGLGPARDVLLQRLPAAREATRRLHPELTGPPAEAARRTLT